MTIPQLPIPNSYWVIPGQLLAGEYPGAWDIEYSRQRMDAFLQAGFNTFINLTSPDELTPYVAILNEQAGHFDISTNHQHFTIGDFSIPTPTHMKSILDAIDKALADRQKVYIHCWGGVGRTGTTVGCFLVRHGKTGQEALDQLTSWWQEVPKRLVHPHTPETEEQIEFILNWKE
jgi:protein-tyrosine phosphatase